VDQFDLGLQPFARISTLGTWRSLFYWLEASFFPSCLRLGTVLISISVTFLWHSGVDSCFFSLKAGSFPLFSSLNFFFPRRGTRCFRAPFFPSTPDSLLRFPRRFPPLGVDSRTADLLCQSSRKYPPGFEDRSTDFSSEVNLFSARPCDLIISLVSDGFYCRGCPPFVFPLNLSVHSPSCVPSSPHNSESVPSM